jgi:hypothetical protein
MLLPEIRWSYLSCYKTDTDQTDGWGIPAKVNREHGYQLKQSANLG